MYLNMVIQKLLILSSKIIIRKQGINKMNDQSIDQETDVGIFSAFASPSSL